MIFFLFCHENMLWVLIRSTSLTEVLLTHCSLETPEMANRADPDQMPQNAAASDLGQLCLQIVQPFFSWNSIYSVGDFIQSTVG